MGLNSPDTAAQNIVPGLITIGFCGALPLIFEHLVLPGAAFAGSRAASVCNALRGHAA